LFWSVPVVAGISHTVRTSPLADVVLITAAIHASIGLTNILPIPALDGGQILMSILRPRPNVEKFAYIAGAVVLLSLAVAVTGFDLWRLINHTLIPGI